MASLDNPANKQSERPPDAHEPHSFWHELWNSAAYQCAEAPTLGATQLIDRADHSRADCVRNFFASLGITTPKEQTFNTAGWYGQTIGSAIGMAVPLGLLGKTSGLLLGTAAEGSLAAETVTGLTLQQAALTGMLYGGVFHPSEGNDLFRERFGNSLKYGASFTLLSGSNMGIAKLGGTEMAARLGVAPVLNNPIAAGVLSGLPSGLAAAEADAVRNGRKLPTGQELSKELWSMTVIGGTFGVKDQMLGMLRGGKQEEPADTQSSTQRQGTRYDRPGDYKETMEVDGTARSYRVHVPNSADLTSPNPLVIGLHGIMRNAKQFARMTSMNEKADQEGFVAAYPDGSPLMSHNSRAWNVGNWGFFHPAKRANDVDFVSRIIDQVSERVPIDPDRIYVTGFSNGGMLTQQVAAGLSHRIAAVAMVGSDTSGSDVLPPHPVSVLDIHGTKDPIVPIHGRSLLGAVQMKPLTETYKFWRKANGINEPLQVNDLGDAMIIKAHNDNENTEVEEVLVRDGMHSWPRPTAHDPADRALSATDIIWDFFKHHTNIVHETEPKEEQSRNNDNDRNTVVNAH